MIPVKTFCSHHNISDDIIFELHHCELIELVKVKRTSFIIESQIPSIERMVRIYTDLEVNAQGIETIMHLLRTLEIKEREIISLQNQLSFYIR